MKIVIEEGSYKLEATQQANKNLWLVDEFSGEGNKINTYASTLGDFLKAIKAIVKEAKNGEGNEQVS
jgi:hypothetical protein